MKARKLKLYILLISFIIGLIPANVYAEETINTGTVETNSNTSANTYNQINNSDNTIADATDGTSEDLNTVDDTLESEESSETEVKDDTNVEDSEDNQDTEEDVKEEDKESKDTSKKDTKKETKKEANYTKSELRLLSALIFAEAGNQSYKGKLAVANVVINRTHSKAFSHVDTIKEAIYDKKWGIQFSVIKDGSNGISPLDRALKLYDTRDFPNNTQKNNMNQCIKAAKSALNGNNNIGDYLFFSQNCKSLSEKYPDHIVIGGHIFYNIK